ncbi:DUF3027 domain-containing protein [Streptomyces phytohabitans]|uniref:DUF3027 domain-containing protein n=1 Tax=Streptomyces phytohabitans TaxID=1150371 RepID=UPI00345B5120
MSAATRNRRTPDKLCADAVELARESAQEAAAPGKVGEWIEAVADGDRVVTHFFECQEPGYRGWRWAATVARASRAKVVTLDETVLLPGPDALLAPQWLPWSERLRPGDLGPGDLLPSEPEDLRLEPGFSADAEEPPNAPAAPGAQLPAERGESAAEEAPDATADPADDGGDAATAADPASGWSRELAPPPERGSIRAVAEELGMGRTRVLSRYGLHTAADRWEEAHGPDSPMAQAAPASCLSCGFLVPLAGSLRQAFGVCANEFGPADGQVVALSYGCGAHSEAAVMPPPPQPPPPVIDETRADALPLHDGDGAGPDGQGGGESGDTSR